MYSHCSGSGLAVCYVFMCAPVVSVFRGVVSYQRLVFHVYLRLRGAVRDLIYVTLRQTFLINRSGVS
jgi:hypothetical protein